MTPVQGDICPLCGVRGLYMLYGGSDQVLCVNDACDVFLWDAGRTLDENLGNAGHVKVTGDGPWPAEPTGPVQPK